MTKNEIRKYIRNNMIENQSRFGFGQYFWVDFTPIGANCGMNMPGPREKALKSFYKNVYQIQGEINGDYPSI